MANRDLAKWKPKPEADHTIWSELPQELVEKCLGHLPVLEIASTLRGVNRAWRNYPGTLPFMNLHNHGMNSNSSFGFLMYGTDRLTNRCETMAINHEALEWQMAPSLQLQGNYINCEVESVSEGLLLLSPRSARPRRIPVSSRSFIVWNPLLGCQQAIPEISSYFTNVNLVVDRASGSFKIVAFSTTYRECLTYSPTISSWHPVHQHAPLVIEGMTFPRQSEFGIGHIAVAYKNCVYVAVASLKNGVHEVGDVSYDVERKVWKPAVMCRVSMSPTRMELYDYCFTKSMFVANDMLYKVVEYQTGFRRLHLRPRPTVQILARSLAQANNAGDWAVIASTVLPHRDLATLWVGSWYACTLKGLKKPIICGLFMTNVIAGPLYMMMYDVGKSTWKKVVVRNAASDSQFEEAEPKWRAMRMVPHYTPSWICPVAECTHNHCPPMEELM